VGYFEDRYTQALRHVAKGRSIIARQRMIIERQRTLRLGTKQSEELRDRFEASQAIFQDDLKRFKSS